MKYIYTIIFSCCAFYLNAQHDTLKTYQKPDTTEFFVDDFPADGLHGDTSHHYHSDKRVNENEFAKVVSDSTHQHKISKDTSLHHTVSLYEEYLADSAYWSKLEPYYMNFDSMSVDPYNFDTTAFNDTVNKYLCCTYHGNDADWSLPLQQHTHITSPFGQRKYKWHYGVDLKLQIGDTLSSVWDGVVRVAKYNYRGYGYYVLIRHHNGLETLYGHMSKILVKVGQKVKAGELIGLGGNTGRSTGPHLHFEVRYKGKAINPESFFDFGEECIQSCDFKITPKNFEYYKDISKAVYHRIRSGDYLGKIARRYHTSVSKICRLNHIRSTTTLRVGRTLRVR